MHLSRRALLAGLLGLATAPALAQGMGFGLGMHDVVARAGGGVPLSPIAGLNFDFNFKGGSYYRPSVPACVSPTTCLTTVRVGVGYADDTSGVWTSFAANTPRVTSRGLLVEEARTNGIRNNSMQGAVAGSPGTRPTNWPATSLGGLVQTIVGTGTENGVDYIDIRMAGTTSTTLFAITFEANNTIAAVTGQTWTHSGFISVVGGSLTNVTGVQSRVSEFSAVPALLINVNGGNFPVSSTQTRWVHTFATTQATTAWLQPNLLFGVNNASPVDVTFRIGWPQLELGGFVTSPIRTTAAAVTRAQDNVTVTSPPTLSGDTYTLFGQGTPLGPGSGTTLSISDGTSSNRYGVGRSSGGLVAFYGVAAGTVFWNGGVGAWTTGASLKEAMGVATADRAAYGSGVSVGTNNSANVPAGMNTVSVGVVFNSTPFNGFVERVGLWPTTRLSNADLATLTAP